MANKVYKIAVEIAAINGLGPVLKVLSRDLLGMGKQADGLTSKMKGLRLAAIGAATALAGIGITKGMFDLAKMGDRIVLAQQRLAAAGASASSVASATNAAINLSTRLPGTTPDQNIDLVTKLRAALGGSTSEAISVLPGIAKAVTALNMSGLKGFAGQTESIVKALDLMGAGMKNGKFDPATMEKNFSLLSRAEIATGGLLPPQQFLQIARLAGFTAQGYNFKDFLGRNLAAFLELGSRAGSGAMQAAMQLYGGNGSIKTIMGMRQYGLLGANGYVHEAGHYAVKSGALYGYKDLLSQGMPYWLQKDLIPKLKSEGVKTSAQMIQALSQIFGSVRAARYVMAMATPSGQALTARDQTVLNKALAVDPYSKMMQAMTPSLTAFGGAFDGLLQVVGMPLVPVAVHVLHDLTNAVLGMESWAKIHPEMVKEIVGGIAGLGVALAVIGTSTVVVALASLGGIPSGIAAAVIALSGAFGVIVADINGFATRIEDIFSIGGGDNHAHMHEITRRVGRYQFPAWVPDAGYKMQGNHAVPIGAGSAGEPLHVIVLNPQTEITNPGALARAMHQGLAGALSAPQTGASGFNGRMSSYGSPAIATP